MACRSPRGQKQFLSQNRWPSRILSSRGPLSASKGEIRHVQGDSPNPGINEGKMYISHRAVQCYERESCGKGFKSETGAPRSRMGRPNPLLFKVERPRGRTGLSVAWLNSKLNGIQPLINPAFESQDFGFGPRFAQTLDSPR